MRPCYYDETKYDTCPLCGGTGMENDSLDHKCYHCDGIGVVEKREEKKPDNKEG